MGCPQVSTRDIRCTDAWLSAVKIVSIFRGLTNDAHKDLLLINAGQFIYVAGKARTRKEATEIARAAVNDGRALETLRTWVQASGGKIGALQVIEAASDRDDPEVKSSIR